MMEEFNYCHVVGKTDVGRKRAANEDSMSNAITQNGLVALVCDGMGGHVGGAVASKIAVAAIVENLNSVYYEDPKIAIGESIDRANQAILQRAKEQPELSGMGSTCVMLLVRNGKVYIGHVGDSRIYLVRSKRIKQLTKDHSFVQMLVDCGDITPEEAEHHSRKNEITNALGIPNMAPATVAGDAIVPEAGDCFVLCSDGLSGMVSNDAICKIIGKQAEMSAQDRVDRLVDMANANGGLDNITVQLVEFSAAPDATVPDGKKSKWVKIGILVVALLLLGGGGYLWLKKPQPVEPAQSEEAEEQFVSDKAEVKVDTISKNLDAIPFKKNGEIVELVFGDSILEMKRKGKQIYVERNVTFNPASLLIQTPGICSQNNSSQNKNYILSFAERKPESSVRFCISTKDTSKVYIYVIELEEVKKNGSGEDFFDGIPTGGLFGRGQSRETADLEKVKNDTTVRFQFEFESLNKDDYLLLNYSARPKLIFSSGGNRQERDVCEEIIIPQENGISYNNGLYWNFKREEKNKQLIFTFNAEKCDAQSESITILCEEKVSGKLLTVIVELRSKGKPVENSDGKTDGLFDHSA